MPQSIIGNYIFNNNPLSQGPMSLVYKGYHQNEGYSVAIKMITPKKSKRVANEVKFLMSLNHPNIVKTYDSQIDEEQNIYIIMEYCNADNLGSVIRRIDYLSEHEIYVIFNQIRLGLQYLTGKNIFHHDLKPENILLHSDRNQIIAKIADFGFSSTGDCPPNTLCGTPFYMSPELLLSSEYHQKSDLWSLGIMIYKILTKRTPFPSSLRSVNDLVENMKLKPQIYVPSKYKITGELRSLVHSLLTYDPVNRIEWDQFFNHPWFQLWSETLKLSIPKQINSQKFQPFSNEDSSDVSDKNVVSKDTSNGVVNKVLSTELTPVSLETTAVSKETTAVSKETTAVSKETTAVSKETTAVSKETTNNESIVLNEEYVIVSKDSISEQVDSEIEQVKPKIFHRPLPIFKKTKNLLVSLLAKTPALPSKSNIYYGLRNFLSKP
jgi:serine/threonine protein kinase